MSYKIEKLDHQGRGITFVDEKITFVENALPNEVVDIAITNKKKKICEAKVTKYYEKSKDRIVPKCKYYNKCGGCDLLHLKYDKQLEYKKQKVKEILYKFAKIEKDISIVPSPKIFNYRDKITMKIEKDKIGYFMKKSNNIIQIEECLLANDKISEVLRELFKIKDFKSCYEISIRNINSIDTALTFYLRNNNETLDFSIENVKTKYIYINKSNNMKEEGNIIANLDKFKFIISAEAFFQINPEQTINLYKKIIDYLNPKEAETVLDLYCGSGTIGIFISEFVKKVVGVEICRPAIQDANLNKKVNKVNNIEFICGDTEDIIKSVDNNYNAIIVDPPRAGLTPNVINDIIRINPEKIVYVSCDPITLARDLNILKENYKIEDVSLFDMFPNTYHVESCVLLIRK